MLFGEGKLYKPSGQIYCGSWEKGHLRGDGKLIHPDWVYEGTFLHDSLEGVGVKKYENGDVYKGYFHSGFEEGERLTTQEIFM